MAFIHFVRDAVNTTEEIVQHMTNTKYCDTCGKKALGHFNFRGRGHGHPQHVYYAGVHPMHPPGYLGSKQGTKDRSSEWKVTFNIYP